MRHPPASRATRPSLKRLIGPDRFASSRSFRLQSGPLSMHTSALIDAMLAHPSGWEARICNMPSWMLITLRRATRSSNHANTRLSQRAGEARKVQCKRCLRLRAWRATAFTCVRDNALTLGITTAEERSRTPQPDIRAASACIPARGPLSVCSCVDAVARGERAGLFTFEHSASVPLLAAGMS